MQLFQEAIGKLNCVASRCELGALASLVNIGARDKDTCSTTAMLGSTKSGLHYVAVRHCSSVFVMSGIDLGQDIIKLLKGFTKYLFNFYLADLVAIESSCTELFDLQTPTM